jgi:hypothetical protein
MYISSSRFSTVHENTKQIPECPTRTETEKELISIAVNHLQLQSKQEQNKQ